MRQSSASWSLAADSGLFLFLQDFSQRMLSKTHEIEKQLDSLIRDTKATDSCLNSVFNDFLMLSNTQFIENRVYDEEVEDSGPKPDALEKQPEQEKTREQKEAELIPKMQEAQETLTPRTRRPLTEWRPSLSPRIFMWTGLFHT
ncbi:unnamed protein product [Pleuronectes platessa]|uniref:Uncharacterized protein n=1 Tax=Pleuronectes platessa TaxID=8262 RepID=A0A9N7VWR4_PLEPL|nr:unnamed protein product [Pleuronectes platessa]